MDSRKIIVGSYLGATAVVWYLVRAFTQWLNLTFYQVRKLPGIEAIKEGLPVVLGLITFLVLMKHPKINEVMEDVVSELKKVTWPNVDDVKKSTIVVLFCILIASGILAFFDLFFGKVVGALMKLS